MIARGRTALIVAAEKCKDRVVEILLSRGAIVNNVDIDGSTALMAAVKHTYYEAHTVKILLINGADIYIRNNDGKIAYDLISEGTIAKKYLKYALGRRFCCVRFHHLGEMKRYQHRCCGVTGENYHDFNRI